MTDIPTSGTVIEIGGTTATCLAVDRETVGATIYVQATKGNADIILSRVPGAKVLRAAPEHVTLSVSLEDCLWAKKGYTNVEDSQHAACCPGAGSESFKQLKAFQRGLHCRLRV
jgi:hypothetical protein